MERFISTKFFRMLWKTSQKGVNTNTAILEKEFAKFAKFVFSESIAVTDKATYREMLVYTRVKLSEMAEVSKKK